MSNDTRRRLGAAGEQLAADHLARRGFQVLERNFRTRWGELDIVASNGHSIVFCEVKCRVANRSNRDPLESVHARKRIQVRRMATQWLRERPDRPGAVELRFDAIGVTLEPNGRLVRLDHLEGAF
jgi:putative endonuclease